MLKLFLPEVMGMKTREIEIAQLMQKSEQEAHQLWN